MQQDENEQYSKVIKYILKNTPFGQANLVVKDLCKILPNLTAQDQVIIEALKDHNEDHLAIFKGQDTQIVSSILNSQSDFYVDQKKSLTVKVDHEKLSIISTDTVELPQDAVLNAFRDALEAELGNYLTGTFSDKVSGAYVIYQGDENDYTYYFGLTAKNINLPNFYCGDWISTWELNKNGLTGKLRIQSHYYEDGNVQLKNSIDVQENFDLDITQPIESAKLVIDSVNRAENKHQKNMNAVYENMPDMFFKAMRRTLPITGTKMNWNENVHKMLINLKMN